MQHSNRLDGYYHQTDRMHMHTATWAVAGPHNIDVRCSLCAPHQCSSCCRHSGLSNQIACYQIEIGRARRSNISCGSDGTLSSTDQTFKYVHCVHSDVQWHQIRSTATITRRSSVIQIMQLCESESKARRTTMMAAGAELLNNSERTQQVCVCGE